MRKTNICMLFVLSVSSLACQTETPSILPRSVRGEYLSPKAVRFEVGTGSFFRASPSLRGRIETSLETGTSTLRVIGSNVEVVGATWHFANLEVPGGVRVTDIEIGQVGTASLHVDQESSGLIRSSGEVPTELRFAVRWADGASSELQHIRLPSAHVTLDIGLDELQMSAQIDGEQSLSWIVTISQMQISARTRALL